MIPASTCVAERDLLWEEFLLQGKKRKLDEDLLRDIFQHLVKNQFLTAGDRGHVRAELERIIRNYVKG